jgi:hypothetical protein
MPRVTTSEQARALRARKTGDPKTWTVDAYLSRLARHVIAAHREQPDITDDALAATARQRLRAEMTELAARSAGVRRERGA